MRFRALLALATVAACAQDLTPGKITDPVKCASDSSQTYALYLPSHYSSDKQWSLILAFDPRAQGRKGVEQLQAAAEKYGYIVAGSNNSRNGPPDISLAAAQAMWTDAGKRFSINPKRIYTAGLSGGARIAMKVALDSDQIAGVIASSAGFPPGHRRPDLKFVVFGTAGTEDFNYLEMRQLDQELSSPHRVVIFEGGHTWLPSALAMQAVEWLEMQAMKSGHMPRDAALIKKIFEARSADAAAQKTDLSTWEALNALVADFQGLTEVTKLAVQANALQQKPEVVEALNKSRQEEEREVQIASQLYELQQSLGDASERESSLKELKEGLTALVKQANAPADSAQRRMARRLMNGVFVDSRELDDQEYQNFVDSLRPRSGR